MPLPSAAALLRRLLEGGLAPACAPSPASRLELLRLATALWDRARLALDASGNGTWQAGTGTQGAAGGGSSQAAQGRARGAQAQAALGGLLLPLLAAGLGDAAGEVRQAAATFWQGTLPPAPTQRLAVSALRYATSSSP